MSFYAMRLPIINRPDFQIRFDNSNNVGIAEYALQQIGLLYAIERKAKEERLTADQTLQLRQAEALPILESLGKWMKETYITSLPKSTIGKALGYSIERWSELIIYTGDGKLNIDNNPVENSIRPVGQPQQPLFLFEHSKNSRGSPHAILPDRICADMRMALCNVYLYPSRYYTIKPEFNLIISNLYPQSNRRRRYISSLPLYNKFGPSPLKTKTSLGKIYFKIIVQFREFVFLCLSYCNMRPDYPSKIFNDNSNSYCCLMQALAADSPCL